MRDSLRIRMGWLHGWVGFLLGLVLVIVFTSGSLAVFDTELTRWMQPELSRSTLRPVTDMALDQVGMIAWNLHDSGQNAFITLPSARDPFLRILHYTGHAFIGMAYDTQDGYPLFARSTSGGQLFFDLHHSLYYGPLWGNILTEIAAIGLLIAVGSGLVIHFRSILPDLLLFRPFASPIRTWMDGHILAGLLFLPFMVMIAYTGAAIHAPRLFPSFASGHHGQPRHDQMKPDAQAETDHQKLSIMLHQAGAIFGPGNIGFVMLDQGKVSITKADSASFLFTRDHAEFSASNGLLLRTVRNKGALRTLPGILRGLHYIRWAPLSLRWLYFISGLAGSIMMSAGLILFLMKHRPRNSTTFLFRLAEAMTISVTIGLPVSCLAYLWTNRLVWSDLPYRDSNEVTAFFCVWAIATAHGAVRCFTGHERRGWNEQFVIFAAFAIALMPLDLLTRNVSGFLVEFGVYKAVDLTTLILGLSAFLIHRRIIVP